MTSTPPKIERRIATLTEADYERLSKMFDERLDRMAELIGYDVSTHESRDEIRRDHEFTREARKGISAIRSRGMMALVSAIVTGIAWLIWKGFKSPS